LLRLFGELLSKSGEISASGQFFTQRFRALAVKSTSYFRHDVFTTKDVREAEKFYSQKHQAMVITGIIFIISMTGVSLFFLKQPVQENKYRKLKKQKID
jgi:hypothetical protein